MIGLQNWMIDPQGARRGPLEEMKGLRQGEAMKDLQEERIDHPGERKSHLDERKAIVHQIEYDLEAGIGVEKGKNAETEEIAIEFNMYFIMFISQL